MGRWWLLVLVFALPLAAPAAGRNAEEERKAAATFVPDVTDDEWDSAVAVALADFPPRLLEGSPRAMDRPKDLPPNSKRSVQLAVLIRPDGTQGVYAIVATDSASLATAAVAFARRQRYEAPLRGGKPIAIRGNVSYELTTHGPNGR